MNTSTGVGDVVPINKLYIRALEIQIPAVRGAGVRQMSGVDPRHSLHHLAVVSEDVQEMVV